MGGVPQEGAAGGGRHGGRPGGGRRRRPAGLARGARRTDDGSRRWSRPGRPRESPLLGRRVPPIGAAAPRSAAPRRAFSGDDQSGRGSPGEGGRVARSPRGVRRPGHRRHLHPGFADAAARGPPVDDQFGQVRLLCARSARDAGGLRRAGGLRQLGPGRSNRAGRGAVARVMRGTPLVPGRAVGPALVSRQPLSFWGGYDHRTGEIIDPRHPLRRETAAGRVLVLPYARGSSTTTAVLLEALRAGTAPAGSLTTRAATFFALAAIV